MAEYLILESAEVNWREYRDLRLEALKTEPQAFGSSYHDHITKGDEEWQQYLQRYNEENGNWMLFAKENQRVVGMLGAFQTSEDQKEGKAQVMALYVKRESRGKGISKALLASLLKKLQLANINAAQLSVNAQLVPAVALYKSFGFTTTGTEKIQFGDGIIYNAFNMEKELSSDQRV